MLAHIANVRIIARRTRIEVVENGAIGGSGGVMAFIYDDQTNAPDLIATLLAAERLHAGNDDVSGHLIPLSFDHTYRQVRSNLFDLSERLQYQLVRMYEHHRALTRIKRKPTLNDVREDDRLAETGSKYVRDARSARFRAPEEVGDTLFLIVTRT
jgi:hypothetical protein